MKSWNDLQLRFDLDLDESEDEAEERKISPEEARQISEAARMLLERNAGEEAPGWWQDYLKLREMGWPWRVASYIAWASAPKGRRKPETLRELATEALGLTGPRQVYKWRQKYPAIDTVVAMMQSAVLWEHRRDVLEALAEMAAQADYKAFNDRKLFLEMTGDYTPRSQVEVGKAAKGDLSQMSDAELDALMGSQLGPMAEDEI